MDQPPYHSKQERSIGRTPARGGGLDGLGGMFVVIGPPEGESGGMKDVDHTDTGSRGVKSANLR